MTQRGVYLDALVPWIAGLFFLPTLAAVLMSLVVLELRPDAMRWWLPLIAQPLAAVAYLVITWPSFEDTAIEVHPTEAHP